MTDEYTQEPTEREQEHEAQEKRIQALIDEQAACSHQLDFDPFSQGEADQERLTREIKDYEALIIEAEREQITPEPTEYETKPPEVDPVYGHPVAATGRANQVWREDIGMSLAAADELTAKTREAGQTLDHSELMENNPAYKADFEEKQKSQIGQAQFEEEPSQAQDLGVLWKNPQKCSF